MKGSETSRRGIAVSILLLATLACGVPFWNSGPGRASSSATPTPLLTPRPSETSFPTASPTLLPTVAGSGPGALATPTEIVVSNDLPGMPSLAVELPPPPTAASVLITNTAPFVVIIQITGREIGVDPGETVSLVLAPGEYAYSVFTEGQENPSFTGVQFFPAGYWTWVLNAAP